MTIFCLTYIARCSYFTKCRCDIDLGGVCVELKNCVVTVSSRDNRKAPIYCKVAALCPYSAHKIARYLSNYRVAASRGPHDDHAASMGWFNIFQMGSYNILAISMLGCETL